LATAGRVTAGLVCAGRDGRTAGADAVAALVGATLAAGVRRTAGAGAAAWARACSAATEALAATALILLSRPTAPTAATSAMRRTRISEATMPPAIPPGV
jgi:hypothetical protein